MAGTLYAKVNVADLEMPQPAEGTSWLRAYQRKELIFYTAVLRDEARYISALSELPELEGVAVRTLSVGSLVVQLQCCTLVAAARLEKLYRRKTLGAIINQVLVNTELLEEMGVQRMVLETIIERADFERCKRELHMREREAAIQQEQRLNLEDRQVETSEFMSRIDCMTSCRDVQADFDIHVDLLNRRYENISENLKEFLMTLKLAKPVHVKEFCTLDDVISVHRYLRASPSVGKSLRTDLVTDFLSIINLGRLKLDDLRSKVKALETHIVKYCARTLVDAIYSSITEVTAVLDPTFDLGGVPEDGALRVNVMDAAMFGRLVHYVPFLLARLSALTDVITRVINTLSLTSSSGLPEMKGGDVEENKSRSTDYNVGDEHHGARGDGGSSSSSSNSIEDASDYEEGQTTRRDECPLQSESRTTLTIPI